MLETLAYLDWSRWICECPEPGCLDARTVYHPETGQRQTHDTCVNGHTFAIVMPPPEEEARIVAAVADRPEALRQWYPEGHARAAEAGIAVGETVAELQAGTAEIGARLAEDPPPAQVPPEAQQRLVDALAAARIEIQPDGSFGGKL